jgi:2-polyprenyl-6-methoxyphenol hydroxylase-like FAD-dependent oxidoreductase
MGAVSMPTGAPLRAVVVGAGLAGLTAAHCLAGGLFDEVTLLERDDVDRENSGDKAQVLKLTGCGSCCWR